MIEIENQYAHGLRRRWKDGKHTRLEHLADEMATGIIAYAVAVRLKHEEYERRERNYERRRRVNARAHARKGREGERQKVLDELVAISTEAAKFAHGWKRPSGGRRDRSSDEFSICFVNWARSRLEYLDHVVDPDGITGSLKEQELFPKLTLSSIRRRTLSRSRVRHLMC